MTHEIMNSITSISSLASSLQESMTSENLPSDMLMAVNSIEKRSNNLIEFTESYRAINDIKLAQKSWFNLADLVKAQLEFLSIELKSIQLSLICAIDQQIYADKNQVEQVIINLILNSIAALRGVVNPSINIHIKSENKYVLLSWIDNGCGIPASIQNDIFIPFFSSKKDGKGIGLSLCRKLMRNNEGSISLLKSLNAHTEFSLRFKV